MADWARQRTWDEVAEGEALPELSFPLPMHRMVVQVAANYDFSAAHHNSEFARAQGAPDIYANNVFLLGMWERTVREYIGLEGRISKLGPFRMTAFTPTGETVVVSGTVSAKWHSGDAALIRIALTSRVSTAVTVTGSVIASLPERPL